MLNICLSFLILSLLAIEAAYGQTSPALTTGPETGHLFIAGGNLRDTSVFNLFIRLAGGPDSPVVIIPTAADDGFFESDSAMVRLKKRYYSLGFNNITILHPRDPQAANSEAFVKPLTRAGGVWFPGGRQWRLARNRQFDMFEILDFYPSLLGIGLDENTAIHVTGNTFEVIGESYVAVYDRNRWSAERDTTYQLAADSREFYFLGRGQRYDMHNRKVIK